MYNDEVDPRVEVILDTFIQYVFNTNKIENCTCLRVNRTVLNLNSRNILSAIVSFTQNKILILRHVYKQLARTNDTVQVSHFAQFQGANEILY